MSELTPLNSQFPSIAHRPISICIYAHAELRWEGGFDYIPSNRLWILLFLVRQTMRPTGLLLFFFWVSQTLSPGPNGSNTNTLRPNCPKLLSGREVLWELRVDGQVRSAVVRTQTVASVGNGRYTHCKGMEEKVQNCTCAISMNHFLFSVY